MRPGDAVRMVQMCEHLGMSLQAWQHRLLQQIEQHDIDVQFAEMVRGFNR